MRASTMQLERREAIELVLSFRASLLSEVATRLFNLVSGDGTGSEVKTNELEKSYKESGALDLKHRGRRDCGKERNRGPIGPISLGATAWVSYSGAVSLGTTEPG